MTHDQSTIRPRGDSRVLADRSLGPALTILFHPETDWIGDVAWLEPTTLLSRNEPEFVDVLGSRHTLEDPVISRRPTVLEALASGNYGIRCDSRGPQVLVDGHPLVEPLCMSPHDLARGVVLEIADRVVLLWHLAARPSPSAGAPTHSDHDRRMIGRNHAMLGLRDEILRVAALDVSVLIRGESGVGKELVAQAIHGASARRDGPFVSVNMGAVLSSTAPSELFGHKKGAFTGAGASHDGYFAQAHGGTLFLDEIGESSVELQVMLLRAIETGEIRPLGAHRSQRVDVRLVTATDADLDQAVAEGRFRLPLLHRLAGFELWVPPLRARRDDIGRLFRHFLRQELERTGESHRLARPAEPGGALWLPPALVAHLALQPWPGNVRQLRNVVRQIAISNHGVDGFRWPSVLRFPNQAASGQSGESAAASRDPESAGAAAADTDAAAGPDERRPSKERGRQGVKLDISDHSLVDALRAHQWRPGPAAAALGIARASLYKLMQQNGAIRQARDLERDELLACFRECGGDLDAMVERLEVSKRSLKLRMTELGLAYS